MRRIKKPFIILLVIILSITIIIKGLFWMATDRAAKKVKSVLPAGWFNYEGISTSLKGSMGITDVTLNLPQLSNPIKIAKIEVVADNVADLLLLNYSFFSSKKNFPDKLTLRLNNVEMSLLDTASIDKLYFPLSIPCGDLKELGPTELIQMGYHKLNADYEISYHARPSLDSLDISIDANIHDLWHFNVTYSGVLSQLNTYAETQLLKNKALVMPDIKFQMKDFTFMNKLHNYCAAREQVSQAEYLKLLKDYYKKSAKKDMSDLTTLEFSDTMINAWIEYNLNPKNLSIMIQPKEAIDMDKLSRLDSDVLISKVKFSLNINDRDIPVSFKKSINNGRKINSLYGSDYELLSRCAVNIDELNALAKNKRISIYLVSGSNYQGDFRYVQDNKVYITLNKSGGASNFSIDSSMINKIYILPDYE